MLAFLLCTHKFSAAILAVDTQKKMLRQSVQSSPFVKEEQKRLYPTKDNEKEETHLHDYLLWVLVGVAVCLTLIAHRPDADDALYVNFAVAAVDELRAPILSSDTRHFPNPPIFPSYKIHAIEMLAAALSFLTRIPAIYIFHLLFPPFAAMLTILAYGGLFRMLAPKHWVWGILAVFVFLCANGDIHRTYGNFSFVRLHQGKGMFVSVILPLLITYGLRFASRPDVRNWLFLSSAQIAAVGVTSTALWVAPTVASLAVLTGIPGMRPAKQVKRLFLGISTSVYVVGIGIYIKLAYQMPAYAFATDLTSIQLLDSSAKAVFGVGRFAVACLVITLTAWFFCDNRIARRLCLIFPICVALIFANPLITGFLAKNLTGTRIYWRVFWLLPLPTMAGLVLLTPLASEKLRLSVWKRYVLYFLFLFVLWVVLPERHIFAKTNRTRIGVPGLKVTDEYQIAKVIHDSLASRPNVIVPNSVSIWLTTMHKYPYPLLARVIAAPTYADEGQRRLVLKLYIMGRKRSDNAPRFFHDGLQQYQIASVCFPLSNPWAEEIRRVLRVAGFAKFQTLLNHEIWNSSNFHLKGV